MPVKSDRKFTVKHMAVPPFSEGHVFSDAEFRRLFPAPKDVESVDDYHEGNIQRLLSLGAIVPALPEAKTDSLPVGAKIPEPQHPAEGAKPPTPVAKPDPNDVKGTK